MKKLFPTKKGAALIITIFFFIAISVAIIQAATIGAIAQLRTYRALAESKYAYVAAEAGIEDIFYRVINSKQIPTTETLQLNGATSTVFVSGSNEEKEVYSVGETDSRTRKLYLKISKITNTNFPYGAQVGEGGATLKEGAKINGTGLAGGDLYSNGQIIGANGVTVTGNVISSSGIEADTVASSTDCWLAGNVENVGQNNPRLDFAQSFVMGASPDTLARISLYIKRVGDPNTSKIRIVTDNAGEPSTTVLASEDLDYSTVSTDYGWVNIPLSNPPTLTPLVKYWIVLDTARSATKYWYWCRSNSDTYIPGAPLYKEDWDDANPWSAVDGDLTFHVYYGGGVSKIDYVKVTGTAKGDTLKNLDVDGDAYYQNISGSTVGGGGIDCDPVATPPCYPGSPTPPYVPLPISTTTIDTWKDDAEDEGVIDGNCGTGGDAQCDTFPLSLGPKRINGNLAVAGGQTLYVYGTLYVTGSIEIGAGGGVGRVECAAAYLGSSCLIIADGFIRVRGGSILKGSGTDGSFVMLLTTKQGCLGDGGSGCTTNDSALALENSVDGAIFYSTDSMVDISNGATISEVVAFKLQMQNNTTITYDESLASTSFVPEATMVTGEWNTKRWNEY
ncbi:MAG: choice-of-anchor R domain-containing protein [bacterium]|nr:choice-of-anchor R domain-containing protein [bacterium]